MRVALAVFPGEVEESRCRAKPTLMIIGDSMTVYVEIQVRVGCVKYLNTRPLIRGWPGNVEFDHPSALCQRLAKGELDVALVSSFEFLRNPIYRIVDDVSISSDGPVYSVVVAHRGEFSDIEEIELDPASETSVESLALSSRGTWIDPSSDRRCSWQRRITSGAPDHRRSSD